MTFAHSPGPSAIRTPAIPAIFASIDLPVSRALSPHVVVPTGTAKGATTMNDRATTPENAADRYAHHAQQAERLLTAIRTAVNADIARVVRREVETKRPIDWADVGTMEEVARKLAEVAQFLGAK
jgi:phytoene dehydrogenase-like protein